MKDLRSGFISFAICEWYPRSANHDEWYSTTPAIRLKLNLVGLTMKVKMPKSALHRKYIETRKSGRNVFTLADSRTTRIGSLMYGAAAAVT